MLRRLQVVQSFCDWRNTCCNIVVCNIWISSISCIVLYYSNCCTPTQDFNNTIQLEFFNGSDFQILTLQFLNFCAFTTLKITVWSVFKRFLQMYVHVWGWSWFSKNLTFKNFQLCIYTIYKYWTLHRHMWYLLYKCNRYNVVIVRKYIDLKHTYIHICIYCVYCL